MEGRLQTEPLTEPDALSVRAVRFLREYSNYLTPQSGVFTADTWTMIAIWVRNTLLNQAVLVLTLCGILGVPWALWMIQFKLAQTTSLVSSAALLRQCGSSLFESSPVVMTAAAALLLYASAVTGHQLRRFGVSTADRRRMTRDMLSQAGVLFVVVTPVITGAALISTAIFNTLGCRADGFRWPAMWELSGTFAAAMTIVAVGGHYSRCFLANRVSTAPTGSQRRWAFFWAAVVIGAAIVVSSVGGAGALVAITTAIATRIAGGHTDARPAVVHLRHVRPGGRDWRLLAHDRPEDRHPRPRSLRRAP